MKDERKPKDISGAGVALSPLLQQAFRGADVDDLRVLPRIDHLLKTFITSKHLVKGLSPGRVHVLKALASTSHLSSKQSSSTFRWQLSHDVIGVKDGLQVHPGLLALQPATI